MINNDFDLKNTIDNLEPKLSIALASIIDVSEISDDKEITQLSGALVFITMNMLNEINVLRKEVDDLRNSNKAILNMFMEKENNGL